jgi:hypothetical protein
VKKYTNLLIASAVLLAASACDFSDSSDGCEWEQKKVSSHSYLMVARPRPYRAPEAPRKIAPAPKYNKTPAKPRKPARSGYRWVLDCD